MKISKLHNLGFRLSLSDGNEYTFFSDENNIAWVKNIAGLMHLTKDSCSEKLNSKKLVFTSRNIANLNKRFIIKSVLPEFYLSKYRTKRHLFCNFPSLSIWIHDELLDVIYQLRNNDRYDNKIENMWLSLIPIYYQSICLGGLPFHAGLAEINGKGVILAAPGGTGKSTCIRRIEGHAKPLCDDEVLVVLDRKKSYMAHPFPTWSDVWSKTGKSWDIQYSVPASAIFFLEQSKTDKVIPIGQGQTALLIYQAALQVRSIRATEKMYINEQIRRMIFNNACATAKVIPAFILRVSPRGCFWKEIDKVL